MENYVIATRYDGKLVCGFKQTKILYTKGGYWTDPVFNYPTRKCRPVLFKTKENAEKRRREMPLNQGTYVRKAKPKECK